MIDDSSGAGTSSTPSAPAIEAIETRPFRLPSRRDFRWAGLNVPVGGFVLVRVVAAGGLEGVGEATPLADWGGDFGRRSGETLSTVEAIVEEVIAPEVVGMPAWPISNVHAAIDRVLRGHPYARCAVDIALHDLWARSLGVPLYEALGGAVRSNVPLAHMIGLMPEDEAQDEAQGAVADGVVNLQLKGGVDADRDIRLVSVLRKRLGGGIGIRVDANQGYGPAKEAIRIVNALEHAGADLIEQPVEGLEAMARVTAGTGIPIIADESCWDIRDALDIVASGAADALSVYLAKAGGIGQAREVAAVAAARGMPCDVNGSLESGIGTAANLHFALATGVVTLPAVVSANAPSGTHSWATAGHYYEDDVISDPLRVNDGGLLPTSGPGLGIEIDESKLDKYSI